MPNFLELLQYSFFTRAILVGGVFSLVCGILGVFVVLRKESLIGHTIANVSFLGVVLGLLLGFPVTLTAIILSVFAAVLIIVLQKTSSTSRDSVLALLDQGALAGAIVLITSLAGYRTDLMQYLFGDILAIAPSDIGITLGLSVVVFVLFLLFSKKILQITFSPELALAAGTKAIWYESLLMVLISVVIALGIKVIGVILLASFLVIPANVAKLIARTSKEMIILSGLVGVFATVIGLFCSYIFDTPSGATIILVLVSGYVAVSVGKALYTQIFLR